MTSVTASGLGTSRRSSGTLAGTTALRLQSKAALADQSPFVDWLGLATVNVQGEFVRARSVARQLVEAFRQRVNPERSDVRGRVAAGVEEDKRGLRDDLEVRPDLSGLVHDVIEPADAVVVDELIDRVETISPGDADEGDVGAVCCLNLCDRRGFTLASSSPGRPEPEQHVLAAQGVEVELAARGSRNERRLEVGGLLCRNACAVRNARCRICVAGPSTRRDDERERRERRADRPACSHQRNLMKTRMGDAGSAYDTS